MKKRIVVICPGRGSYNKEDLGYFKKFHGGANAFLREVDRLRIKNGLPAAFELDSQSTYQGTIHTAGEHASDLIHACAISDFRAIDPSTHEVVAVLGNSMGWYIALTASQAVNDQDGIEIVHTMGNAARVFTGGLIGGQVIYPVSDENWIPDPKRIALVSHALETVNQELGAGGVFVSIRLGGYVVLGGSDGHLKRLIEILPKDQERYPLRLLNHMAFHTPLLKNVSAYAFTKLSADGFKRPNTPMIDGRGVIWNPLSTDPYSLYEYTFGHQVIAPYDFTLSLEVALKEFAPDHLVLLGPGGTLGGAIGQTLVGLEWMGIKSKADFLAIQEKEPFLIAMGREDQRKYVAKS